MLEEVTDPDFFIAAPALRSVADSAFYSDLARHSLQVPLHIDHLWTFLEALWAVVFLKKLVRNTVRAEIHSARRTSYRLGE